MLSFSTAIQFAPRVVLNYASRCPRRCVYNLPSLTPRTTFTAGTSNTQAIRDRPISQDTARLALDAAEAIYADEDEDASPRRDAFDKRIIKREPREYLNLANKASYTPRMLSKGYREYRPPYHWPLAKLPGPCAKEARESDIFYLHDIDPLKEFNNARLLSSFTTSLGKIKARHATGLSQRNQRRLGRAIRRARAMSIVPYMSKNRLA